MKTYMISEIFHSLQGEGVRAGTSNVFVRFTGCNLRCRLKAGPKSPGGFDCDTEFESGQKMTAEEIHDQCASLLTGNHGTDVPTGSTIVLTGGEPGLQVDDALIAHLHERGWKLAIETNGSVSLPDGIDWITVSPKVDERAIQQRTANEVKYVRSAGQSIPDTVVAADHYLLSPAFNGPAVNREALAWCIKQIKENPPWRLSLQNHKHWQIR